MAANFWSMKNFELCSWWKCFFGLAVTMTMKKLWHTGTHKRKSQARHTGNPGVRHLSYVCLINPSPSWGWVNKTKVRVRVGDPNPKTKNSTACKHHRCFKYGSGLCFIIHFTLTLTPSPSPLARPRPHPSPSRLRSCVCCYSRKKQYVSSWEFRNHRHRLRSGECYAMDKQQITWFDG